jgi:flagellar hook-basal body complex protein FliE
MNGIGAIGPAIGAGGSVKEVMALREQLFERSKLLRELQQSAASAPAPATQTAPTGFGDSLRQALAGVNETQARATSLSEGYERGEVTDIAKVMLARQEAGIAFEATLQVRNKLISAYQETMRMGI